MNAEIINSYADVLFEMGQEKKKLDLYFKQIKKLFLYFKNDQNFIQLIANKSLSKNDRKLAMINILNNLIDHNIINLFQVIIDDEQSSSISKICETFLRRCDLYFGNLFGVVTTASPLSLNQIKILENSLKNHFGQKNHKVILHNEVIPDVIGGIKISIGSYTLDQTYKNQLKELKEIAHNQLSNLN